MSYFDGKVVWITGASSGIGEELCYLFAEQRSRLVISSNDLPELDRVAARCAELDAEVVPVYLDLTDIETLEEKAEYVLSKMGAVDLLINNAGMSQRSFVMETTMSVYQRLMMVNFMGHVALTKALLPSMVARRSGHIVVVSSIMGKYGLATRSGYSAAKHALHGFFEALRQEMWDSNINVTIVCPAGVKTKVSINAITGDGTAYGKMDDEQQQGISAHECAREILQAVIKNKEEVIIAKGMMRHVMLIKRLPPLLGRIIVRRGVTRYLRRINEEQSERK